MAFSDGKEWDGKKMHYIYTTSLCLFFLFQKKKKDAFFYILIVFCDNHYSGNEAF